MFEDSDTGDSNNHLGCGDRLNKTLRQLRQAQIRRDQGLIAITPDHESPSPLRECSVKCLLNVGN